MRNLITLLALLGLPLFVTGCVDTPGVDDDDDGTSGDDDDAVVETVSFDITATDNGDDIDEFDADVEGADVEDNHAIVPDDPSWHNILVEADVHQHAACATRVIGGEAKVNVTHHEDYQSYYPEAGNGHWDGNVLQISVPDGGLLTVPMNYDMTGTWVCDEDGDIETYPVTMLMGEVANGLFGHSMFLNGHSMIGENGQGFRYEAVIDEDSLSGTKYISDELINPDADPDDEDDWSEYEPFSCEKQ